MTEDPDFKQGWNECLDRSLIRIKEWGEYSTSQNALNNLINSLEELRRR